jgi:carbon-monoxide dehydrogenase medium subunit
MTLFLEPRSVEEALAAYASHPDARLLSGGATLVAMMNAGLAEPSAVISLKSIESLSGISAADGGEIVIGGMTRHRMTAESDLFGDGQKIVPFAARRIANPPVRNMGTIGGSISFSDPAADYPAALVAADARIAVIGPSGRRMIEANDFFIDWYTTALEEGEIVVAVHVPPAPRAGAAYEKLVKTEGDMGIATVAAVVEMDGGKCTALRVAVGACGPHPVRLRDAEKALIGGNLDDEGLDGLGAALAAELDPVDDVRASADYRRLVVPRMVRKAVRAARQAAEAEQ